MSTGGSALTAFWMLVPPDTQLPEDWTRRATHVLLISLRPSEIGLLIERKGDVSDLDASFLMLVSRGLPAQQIAREVGITDRSVYRRLSKLRHEFGVATNAELTAELARRGF